MPDCREEKWRPPCVTEDQGSGKQLDVLPRASQGGWSSRPSGGENGGTCCDFTFCPSEDQVVLRRQRWHHPDKTNYKRRIKPVQSYSFLQLSFLPPHWAQGSLSKRDSALYPCLLPWPVSPPLFFQICFWSSLLPLFVTSFPPLPALLILVLGYNSGLPSNISDYSLLLLCLGSSQAHTPSSSAFLREAPNPVGPGWRCSAHQEAPSAGHTCGLVVLTVASLVRPLARSSQSDIFLLLLLFPVLVWSHLVWILDTCPSSPWS